ncbi:MAG: nitroreductase family protein [Syntrophomonadaceae bacterium]|jgi:nitroreductase
MLELLKRRRSIRKYSDDNLNKDQVDQLVKAALLAPSSRGIRPWEFIVVDDKILLSKLSWSKEHGSAFLKGAALAIVVIADPQKSDVWVEDTSIASTIIQLMAEAMDLGSCWIQIRNRQHNESIMAEDYVKKVLAIHNKYKVESIIAIGYKAEQKKVYKEDELLYNKVHLNNFGNLYY